MTIETREQLARLAASVEAALANAGLPSNLDGSAGARVEPGWDDDERWRLVEVRWRRDAAVVDPLGEALLRGVRQSPQMSFDYAVGAAMAEAMYAILDACGFQVARGDEDSPTDLWVMGCMTARRTSRSWGRLRDDCWCVNGSPWS